MIVLPDEDEEPVSAQVNAAIGEALRHSVAGLEPSPGFQARLAAALDAAERAQAGGAEREAASGEEGQGGSVPGMGQAEVETS